MAESADILRKDLAAALLGWYDGHARRLPWRISPGDRAAGIRPDPYAVWLSEVMLQQTTVAAVSPYFDRFVGAWPDVHALAAARDGDVMAAWAGLGYYARARNLLACARIVVSEHGGRFPQVREELLKLPGIGPYTAAAIAAIAFDAPECVVDGNVERVIALLFAVHEPLPAAKAALRRQAEMLTPDARAGDYAQAMMDLGATICTPRTPDCAVCPLSQDCQARLLGVQAELPKRVAKQPKPVRHGIAYIARKADGAWLLERRPPTGLLGGMLGWPGTNWRQSAPPDAPPFTAAWHDPKMEVRHTFTHFHLRLGLRLATIARGANAVDGIFLGADEFDPGALPTVMAKAYNLAAAWDGWN